MTLEEIKSLPDTEDVVLPAGEIKSIAAQLEAQAEQAAEKTSAAFIKSYNSNSNERAEQLAHFGKYIKATIKKDESLIEKVFNENPQFYSTKAAFSEASSGAGLYTVPTIFTSEILSNVERYGFARRLGKIYPMPNRVVNFTTGGAVTVAWPGANTAPTPFDATSFFGQTAITANTMAAAYIIQKELLDDSISDLLGYLGKAYGKAIAKEEDLQYFNGTGSPFTGVIGAATTNVVSLASTKTSVANITWTKMNDLKLKVNTDIQNDGVYVIKQTGLGYLFNEVDNSLRPIRNNLTPEALPSVGIDAAPYTYNNSPLYVVPDALFPNDAANKAIAIFGDFANYGILGVRKEMTMETFDQAYATVDLSGQRQIAIQVTERIGIGFPVETAFAVLKTAAS